jgi:hypothetical protein
MSWWPFKRKSKPFQEDPHIRGTQVWLQDLREVCERNFDNPTEGQRMVRELQVEWTAANAREEVDEALLAGLNRRTLRLLRADAVEWLKWLDDDDSGNRDGEMNRERSDSDVVLDPSLSVYGFRRSLLLADSAIH